MNACVCFKVYVWLCGYNCVKGVWRRAYPCLSLSFCSGCPPSLSVRVVRLDWSHPGRPSGIMLGFEVLRRTLRSCAGGSTGITSAVGEELNGTGGLRFRCSYLQCPASHGVCSTSCFHPDLQVIVLPSFSTHKNVYSFSNHVLKKVRLKQFYLWIHWHLFWGFFFSVFIFSSFFCYNRLSPALSTSVL